MVKRRFFSITPNTVAVITAIFVVGIIFFPVSQGYSDEIRFQGNSTFQQGQILEEDAQSIVVRFSKSAVKSIKKDHKRPGDDYSGKITWEKRNGYLILNIPRQLFETSAPDTGMVQLKPIDAPGASQTHSNGKIERPEERSDRLEEKEASNLSVAQQNENLRGALLKEEMGSVEGIIKWKGRPLTNGKVKIILVQYTGFSLGSLKKAFSKDSNKEVIFDTQTDGLGRYAFDKAPPGSYRIYWIPDGETEWIHRVRDKPDFEVLPGKLTVQNIPDNKK